MCNNIYHGHNNEYCLEKAKLVTDMLKSVEDMFAELPKSKIVSFEKSKSPRSPCLRETGC